MIHWSPTEITAALVAISGLLAVILVQARSARAEARHRDAETKLLLSRIDDNASKAKEQVTNSHVTNMRDDMDSTRFAVQQIVAEQARQAEVLTGVAADMREVRSSVARLDEHSHTTHREIFGRLHALESKEG